MGIIGNSAMAGLVLLALTGCSPSTQTKREYSMVLHEDAVVEDVIFMPARHGSDAGPTFDLTGEGGIGIAITNVSLPEKYAVIFVCQQHKQKFIIQGEGYSASRTDDSLEVSVRDLWSKISKGDTVDVSYRELFMRTYKDTDGDGKRELIAEKFLDYDFLDANKKLRIDLSGQKMEKYLAMADKNRAA